MSSPSLGPLPPDGVNDTSQAGGSRGAPSSEPSSQPPNSNLGTSLDSTSLQHGSSLSHDPALQQQGPPTAGVNAPLLSSELLDTVNLVEPPVRPGSLADLSHRDNVGANAALCAQAGNAEPVVAVDDDVGTPKAFPSGL